MNTALVQPLDKGQITIPVAFRQKLGITKDSILKLEIRGQTLVIKSLNVDWKDKYIRTYSNEELQKFYELDRLDAKTKTRIKKYIGLYEKK